MKYGHICHPDKNLYKIVPPMVLLVLKKDPDLTGLPLPIVTSLNVLEIVDIIVEDLVLPTKVSHMADRPTFN